MPGAPGIAVRPGRPPAPLRPPPSPTPPRPPESCVQPAAAASNRQETEQPKRSAARPGRAADPQRPSPTPDFCVGKTGVDCGNLLISVRMRAPSAPHMSFGSRATQAKPEALSSCSEQLPETASFLRVTAVLSPRAPRFPRLAHGNLFWRAPGRTPHRCANGA